MKPNIFDYAAKEHSQDAFVAWLLNYADPSRRDGTYTSDDESLFVCGKKLIREMLFTHDITIDSRIAKVRAECHRKGIDIWAEVELENRKKYLIIIEHKASTALHAEQLEKYKAAAASYCRINGFESPVCIYLKTRNENGADLEDVWRTGFSVITRRTLVFLMSEFKKIQNNI